MTGVDLTAEFVETANALSELVGLSGRVRAVQASALALPADDASFDAATMLHVGMNIADKTALVREVARLVDKKKLKLAAPEDSSPLVLSAR